MTPRDVRWRLVDRGGSISMTLDAGPNEPLVRTLPDQRTAPASTPTVQPGTVQAFLPDLDVRLFCARGSRGEPLTAERARHIGVELIKAAAFLEAAQTTES